MHTEWPQPCSTHHEHHPGAGFPVLFFCSPSLASEFLPKSQECALNRRNHAARIISIIRVTAFPSSSSAAFHLHLNFFEVTRVRTEWPQPCSTHHEHHPGDGFPVLFFCSLSLASEFVPTKITRVRAEWLHHEHHPGDGFPVLFFCSLSLASEFLPKSQECARNGRNHAARIMSIIRVTAFPSSSSAAFHLHLNFFPNHESVRTEWPQPCSTHHEHHPGDGFPVLFFCSLSLASEFVPTKITRVRTEWLQPFSTHHEHHPGDGFLLQPFTCI